MTDELENISLEGDMLDEVDEEIETRDEEEEAPFSENFIIIKSVSNNRKHYVALSPGQTLTVSEALQSASIFTAGPVSFWVSGQEVGSDTPLGHGTTVVIQGVNKGG